MSLLNDEHIAFRNGIFLAASRTYGEIYMEPIIRYHRGVFESDTNENDAVNKDGEFEEYKCTKVLVNKQNKKCSLYESIIQEQENGVLNRLIPFDGCYDYKYDANIQNVKRDHFSTLVYVMLFEDCIKIFESKSEDISSIPNWSGKHGRFDAIGKSGQFPINKNNIKWHLDNNLVDTLTWSEIFEITKNIS